MSARNTISKLHIQIQRVKAVSVFQLQTTNKRLRSLLFGNVKRCRLVVSYWLCGTTYWSHLQRSSSPRRMSKTSLTTNHNSMTSQEKKDFIYTMAEAWNQKQRSNLRHSTSVYYECILKHAASLWLTPTYTHTFRVLLVGEIDISQCLIYMISSKHE